MRRTNSCILCTIRTSQASTFRWLAHSQKCRMRTRPLSRCWLALIILHVTYLIRPVELRLRVDHRGGVLVQRRHEVRQAGRLPRRRLLHGGSARLAHHLGAITDRTTAAAPPHPIVSSRMHVVYTHHFELQIATGWLGWLEEQDYERRRWNVPDSSVDRVGRTCVLPPTAVSLLLGRARTHDEYPAAVSS